MADRVEAGEVLGDSVKIPKKTKADKEAESAKNIDELNSEINANFSLASDAISEWMEEAKEDIKFAAGDQWDEDARATLKAQGRPCMTFNKIRPMLKLITGHFVQNASPIQVSPEGGEDQKFSEIADKIIKHVDEQANLEFNFGYMFTGGETTGRTFIELYLDYERDPIFGELKSIYHGKPGIILPDPRGTAYDFNQDRQFVFKLVKKTKAELKELYPKKAKEIDELTTDTENPALGAMGKEGDKNNYGLDKDRSGAGLARTSGDSALPTKSRQFHVKEYWRIKYIDKWFVYFVDKGDTAWFESEDEAEAEIEKRKAAYEAEGGIPEKWATKSGNRKKKQMHVAIRCGGKILADGKSPFEPYYSGFPFFQYIAGWIPEAENEKDAVQGMVRGLKDPQREKNKSRSAFLHIVSTSANSGWIGDEDALTDAQKTELKGFGSSPGITVWKKRGSQLDRITPVPAPLAQQVREKAADDDFKETSGLNADLLAMDQSANPSGKAIALRIRQAITILEPDFRNFRYTKKLVGNCLLQIVPTLYDIAKLKKILGVKFMEGHQIDDVDLKSFIIQIEDAKYNVRVAEKGDTKTSREETFEDLMQMLQSGIQLPFEVLADFMTLPNKTELINKVKEFQANAMANAQAAAGAKASGPAGAPRQ